MDNNCNDFETYCDELQSRSGHISPSTENLFSNRDVLERRLKCRLEREDLVVRGIIPPHHASPNIAAQIHQLERAKTGDLLQKRMRVRASRQQLVQRHILADSKVDASLQEKQSALERHLIADHLNEQLFNRPGPLELIKENILEVEPKFADAVKHGCVPFHATCEDLSTSPISVTFSESTSTEVDCGSSVDSLSPFATETIDTFAQAFSEHVSVENADESHVHGVSPYQQLVQADDSKSLPVTSINDFYAQETSHKGEKVRDSYMKKQPKSNKKNKHPQNKSKKKKYKYHEYKPPGTVPQTYQAPLDERYKRLLEQQQMFLQLQVMKQNALFAALNSPKEEDVANNEANAQTTVKEQPERNTVPTSSIAVSGISQCSQLDDLRVIDLRSQLRQRGLPVSGSKAKLLERLRSYEDKKTGDMEKKSTSNATNLCATSTSPHVSSATSSAAPVATSSNQNTIMKVTTYATQNGQTFQVVQAVPNEHPQIQYQMIPESLMLGQTALQNAQMQQSIELMNTASQNQPTQITKPIFSPEQNMFQSENTSNVGTQLPANLLQQIQYIRQLPTQSADQVQIQLNPTAIATSGGLALDNKDANALQSQQLSFVRPVNNKVEASPLQQVSRSDNHNKGENLRRSRSTSDQYQDNQFILQNGSRLPDYSQTENSSNNNQSALLLHLQQIRNSLNLPGDDRPKNDMNVKNDDLVTKYSLQAENMQQFNSTENNFDSKNLIDNSFIGGDGRHSYYRGRSYTVPARCTNQMTNNNFLNGSMSNALVMQQNGNVVVMNGDGQNANLNTKDSRSFTPSHVEDTSRVKTETSEDLLEILGEISSCARSTVDENGFHPDDFHHPNSIPHDFHHEAKKSLESEKIQLGRINPKQETPFQSSCSKPKLTNARTYGSLPGDLNMLGVPGQSTYNSVQPAHGSCTSLVRNPPDTGSQLMDDPFSGPNNIAPSPMNVEDDCINMDIDESAYFTSENELDWLNLNQTPVSSNNEQKVFDRTHGKEPEFNFCVDPVDLNIVNPYEYGKPQGMNSIFDLDNNQPPLMSIDGQDADKWTF